jgi:uncharacterized membrane protein HdeD (DUF308 family)
VGTIAITAGFYGLAVGIGGIIETLSYLWYTAEPPNRKRSEQLWGMIAIAGAITFIGSIVIYNL